MRKAIGVVYLCLNRQTMKSFRRTKIINGIEYVYEITPYYDAETKKVRQKSTYIGKNQDGTVRKVREKKVHHRFSR